MIEIVHLRKQYDLSVPLKDVSVTINDGDVISIIGPSGTGKSTLIRCINMLERPTSGQIIFNGEDITAPNYDLTKARQKMGMVFQSFNLFSHLTVIENIMLAQIDILKKSRQEAYDKGMELLKLVGLSGRELSYPDELSGGQKQRVAIARTLAMDPEVLLFDEPTSALDPTMVGEVLAIIKKLVKTGKTMLIVTHEMNFARDVANRIFYMDQGGIYEDGSPSHIFDNPQKELTKKFIRKIKAFEVEINDPRPDFVKLGVDIEDYCSKNDVPEPIAYRLSLAFEEMTQQILSPIVGKEKIRVTINYYGDTKKAEMFVAYSGKPFKPDDSENTFSYDVLRKMVNKVTHYYDLEERLNTVQISV